MVAGALTLWKGWNWLDSVVSLVIVVVIIAGTLSLFRQSLHMLFDGVPFEVDPDAARQYLESLPGVGEVRDLHIWAMSLPTASHASDPIATSSSAFAKAARMLARFQP